MCELLKEVIDAHGGAQAWDVFTKIKADVAVAGKIWKESDHCARFALAVFEMQTREETVSIFPKDPNSKRSFFHRNVLTVDAADGGFIETQYNPRPSFLQPIGSRIWDDFQLAYLCSYSVWVALTQPFLFTYPGFEVEELGGSTVGEEKCRKLRVAFPSHIASHSPELLCHVGPDGLMRRQDWRFDVLGDVCVTSYPSNYKNIQGIMVPMMREMYRASDEHREVSDEVYAFIEVNAVEFS